MIDANNQEVSSQNFTTNEFGSYHGSFILPKGKLNGTFYLQTDSNSGYKDIRVEEYKRPKFEVTFDPVKDEYKYGQTIELKGKAMMFSGVALSNTSVNYEIKNIISDGVISGGTHRVMIMRIQFWEKLKPTKKESLSSV